MDRKQTDTGRDPERQAVAASAANSAADSGAALETAVRRFRKGDLRGTEAMCRNILAARPRDVQALHLLGVVTARSGSKEIAVEFISKAVALDPGLAEAHVNLGVV